MIALPLMLAAAIASADAEAAVVAAFAARSEQSDLPEVARLVDLSQMRFTLLETEARRILKAEGVIDADASTRLTDASREHDPNRRDMAALAGRRRTGRQPGRDHHPQAWRSDAHPTGWACFLRLQLHLHGRTDPVPRRRRAIRRPGMFTHLADKDAVHAELSQSADEALGPDQRRRTGFGHARQRGQ